LTASDGIARAQGAHCLFTFAEKARPCIRAHDSQHPDILPAVASAADAPVSQVEA
jgi:hypothetical protein